MLPYIHIIEKYCTYLGSINVKVFNIIDGELNASVIANQ